MPGRLVSVIMITGVGHSTHRHDNPDRSRLVDTTAGDFGIEAPEIVTNLFDAHDLVAVGIRSAILPAGDRERLDQDHIPHLVRKSPFGLG